MTPEDQLEKITQIEKRLRTIYQCALTLLLYESELKRQLSEVNVSHQFSPNSSGDNKTLSPEELAKIYSLAKLKPGRKQPSDH